MSFGIAYFGLPLGAYLLALDGHDLRSVVLSPIDAPGRRRVARVLPTTPRIETLAGRPEAMDGKALDRAVVRALERAEADLIVSWFWTRRIPQTWLGRAKHGGIGAHPSLLPRHRGPNPYFAAIDAGDRETGVTVHVLTPEYDEGDVLATRVVEVGDRDSWQLARALDRPSLALLREVVQCYSRGEPPPRRAQSHEGVTWAAEPEGDALHVRWDWSTERVLRRIRALAPVPGLPIEIEGLSLFVTRARATLDFPSALEPGEAAVFGAQRAVVVRTGDGAIALVRAVFASEEDDRPDDILEETELAQKVGHHLEHRSAGRVS